MSVDNPEVIAALRREAIQFGNKIEFAEPNINIKIIPERSFGKAALGKIVDVPGPDTYEQDLHEESSQQVTAIAPYVAIIQDTGSEIGEQHVPHIPSTPSKHWANMPA